MPDRSSSRVTATAPANLAYPAQDFPRYQFNIWKSVAPRVHVTYDLTGANAENARIEEQEHQAQHVGVATALVAGGTAVAAYLLIVAAAGAVAPYTTSVVWVRVISFSRSSQTVVTAKPGSSQKSGPSAPPTP